MMTVAEAVEKAKEEVFALCRGRQRGGHEWRMTIPVDSERDSDQIIIAGLTAQAVESGELGAAIEQLHGLVEATANGWAGALPHGEDVSMLVTQDRLAIEDAKRKADEIRRTVIGETCSGLSGFRRLARP